MHLGLATVAQGDLVVEQDGQRGQKGQRRQDEEPRAQGQPRPRHRHRRSSSKIPCLVMPLGTYDVIIAQLATGPMTYVRA